jgi:HlyD family secretion protein
MRPCFRATKFIYGVSPLLRTPCPFSSSLTAIDSKASFTPENVYFQSDGVQQVFGVKLNLEQPVRLAKPGMPADGEIPLH